VGSGIGVNATLAASDFTANSGTLLTNYTLPTSAAGTGTITQATLTAGLTGTVNKVYDGTTAATLAPANYTLKGVVSGDTVALNNPTSGTYASKNIGSAIGVAVSGLAISGADAGNYLLSSTSASANIGTITQAILTAGLTGTVSKVYDGTTAATLAAVNYTLPGVFSGDAVSLNNPVSGIYASKNVGTGIGVSVMGLALSGADAGNYALSSASASGNIGTITAKALTATIIGNPTKIYDATTAATLTGANYSLGGFVLGEGARVTQKVAAYATANADTGVGISASLVAGNFEANAGTLLSNYTLPASASGTGTIAAKTLTAGLTGTVSKVFDGTTTATLTPANYTLSGVIGGDTVTINNPIGTYASPNVGSAIPVAVNALAIGGVSAGNYALSNTSASANIGVITPPPLSFLGDVPTASQPQPVGENEVAIVLPFLFQPTAPLFTAEGP
jgi:hypothetical protein